MPPGVFLLQLPAELSKARQQHQHAGKDMGEEGDPPLCYMNVFLLKL